MVDMDKLLKEIANAVTEKEIKEIRERVLGKKGIIAESIRLISSLSTEEKIEKGKSINLLKSTIDEAYKSRLNEVLKSQNDKPDDRFLDLSLPTERKIGNLHPINYTMELITKIWNSMGFASVSGSEIENTDNNFTYLNVEENHPARSEHDTFYLPSGLLLRTHTSPVQIRFLKENKPPVKIVVPGRVFRSDYDQTHTPMFHQAELLCISEDTNMGHLKGCLEAFCKIFFEVNDLPIRIRPSFFPFTEPSIEVDVNYKKVNGKIIFGKGDKWLEILGAGMVHPNVLRNCGIDSEKYRGFAAGMGIERLAMLKFGIEDLRMFYKNDIRWLDYYGHSPF